MNPTSRAHLWFNFFVYKIEATLNLQKRLQGKHRNLILVKAGKPIHGELSVPGKVWVNLYRNEIIPRPPKVL